MTFPSFPYSFLSQRVITRPFNASSPPGGDATLRHGLHDSWPWLPTPDNVPSPSCARTLVFLFMPWWRSWHTHRACFPRCDSARSRLCFYSKQRLYRLEAEAVSTRSRGCIDPKHDGPTAIPARHLCAREIWQPWCGFPKADEQFAIGAPRHKLYPPRGSLTPKSWQNHKNTSWALLRFLTYPTIYKAIT